jgi:hypothetical protein
LGVSPRRRTAHPVIQSNEQRWEWGATEGDMRKLPRSNDAPSLRIGVQAASPAVAIYRVTACGNLLSSGALSARVVDWIRKYVRGPPESACMAEHTEHGLRSQYEALYSVLRLTHAACVLAAGCGTILSHQIDSMCFRSYRRSQTAACS